METFNARDRIKRSEMRNNAPDLFEFISKTDKLDKDGSPCGFTFMYQGVVCEALPDFIGEGFTQSKYFAEFVEETIRWDQISINIPQEHRLSFTKMLEKNFDKIISD